MPCSEELECHWQTASFRDRSAKLQPLVFDLLLTRTFCHAVTLSDCKSSVSLTLRFGSEAGVTGLGRRLVDERAQLTGPVLFLLFSHAIIGSLIVDPANQTVSDRELTG